MIFKNLKMDSLLNKFQVVLQNDVSTARNPYNNNAENSFYMSNLITTKFQSVENYDLDEPLKELIESGFLKIDDMLFFTKKAKKNPRDFSTSLIKERYGDKSGFEKSMNTIFIEDYIKEGIVEKSFIFLQHLKESLLLSGCPDFTVFLSIEDLIDFGLLANISFCISRWNEVVIDTSSIEDYSQAIMVEFVKKKISPYECD